MDFCYENVLYALIVALIFCFFYITVLVIWLICFFCGCACLGENCVHRRGRGTITMDILEATLIPRKKMRIMYRANLNYARFNKYFLDFLGKGFIEQTFDSEGKTLLSYFSAGQDSA